MSKTIINKARAEARTIAARDGSTYQQALDAVARDRGHAHWSAFRSEPIDGAVRNLDSLILHAWRRRASALRFDMDENGFAAFVTNRNRTGLCAGGDPVNLGQLRRAAISRLGVDIEDEDAENRVTIEVDGQRLDVTVNVARLGGARRLVVHMPDAVFGKATLDELGIRDLKAWKTMMIRPDHGLVLVVGRTSSGRSTTIDRTIRAYASSSPIIYGYEGRHLAEAVERSHDRIVLVEMHGDTIDGVLASAHTSRVTAGARILGGIEQRIEPDGDAGILISRVVDFEADGTMTQ